MGKVSSKILTSVLACGFVKQPCNTEPKGQNPGSHRPIVASTGISPATAAAKGRLPIFARVSISSLQLQLMLEKACLTKQLVGIVIPPLPSCDEMNQSSDFWWYVHTHWGLLCPVFFFVPSGDTGNPSEASHLQAS